MGNNEEGKPTKSEKSSSPTAPDQTNIHVYPDWAAMQAYYGPQVPFPPYYNSALASGHAPHPYMWGTPQPLMPPYGTPFAAVYSHGGVYGHPAVTLAAAPVSVETPTKSSANRDRGLVKKSKGLDGLAMSVGNGTAESTAGGEHLTSQSSETEASIDKSDGNTAGGRERSREGTPTLGGNVKTEGQAGCIPFGDVNAPSNKTLASTVAPTTAPGKSVEPLASPGMATALELQNPSSAGATKASPNFALQPCVMQPSEACLQNERELKRERRKQSNRESARRSRLRKQAETEELAHKVESLTAENVALKSEITQLANKSEELRLENTALMERLKNGQSGHVQENMSTATGGTKILTITTENLLSRVNNSASVNHDSGEGDPYERSPASGLKLRQLLDASPRADAVAAR